MYFFHIYNWISDTSLDTVHSSPKEVHIDFAQFFWWPQVTDPNPGSCQDCQMVLGVICKRPHSKNSLWFWHGVFCKFLSRPFDKIKMTRGRGQWPRDFRKLGWFSCALLLEKSVHAVKKKIFLYAQMSDIAVLQQLCI